MIITHLYFKDEVVAPKSKGNDPQGIKHTKSILNSAPTPHRIIVNPW